MLNRRLFCTGAGSTFAAGCVSCPELTPFRSSSDLLRIGDAHVHFFNAADLPIAGFLEFVLLPEHLPDATWAWPALIHTAEQLLKPLAMSAAEEARRLFPPWTSEVPTEVTPREFADLLADEIEAQARARGTLNFHDRSPRESVADSYVLLGAVLAEVEALERGAEGPLSRAQSVDESSSKSLFDAAVSVDREFLAEVVHRGVEAAPRTRHASFPIMSLDKFGSEEICGSEAIAAFSPVDLFATLKWCRDMTLSRCRHVHDYLAALSHTKAQTSTVVNLLVDYDSWLGDGPLPGSSTEQQVAFWTRYARAASKRLTIATFAGYDPLRDAESALDGDFSYWSKRERWFRAHRDPESTNEAKIVGFKLYPPMGFRPIGNAGLEASTERAGRVVRERWTAAGRNPSQIGARVEEALEKFFKFCAHTSAPLLAHASDSNEASCGTGEYASPEYWLHRVRATPGLRICLAHHSRDGNFVQWVKKLLSENKNDTEVNFDISYADELLDGSGSELLSHIREICSEHDPGCEHFMFGSDWIMLGREPHSSRYLGELIDAAEKQPWWNGPRLNNLLSRNLDRFLGVH